MGTMDEWNEVLNKLTEAWQQFAATILMERRRRLYFLKQKVIGVFMLVLTIFAVKLLDGDATIALLTVPLGLTLIFSKEKWWMDNYYFENEANERRKNHENK